MTIQGNLGTIGQGEDNVLRSINRDRRTGRLSIFYENEQRKNVQDVVFIENGMVIGLKSLDKYGVKDLLVFAGKLTRQQVDDATARAAATGDPNKTAEALLMDEGVITRELVVHAIATLIRGCIQRIMTKPYGLYIFHPSDQLKGVRAMTRISMLQVVLDYCRALKNPDVINSLVPSLEHLPKLTVNIEDIRKRFHLTDDEWRFLFQVSGDKSLATIQREGGFEDEKLRRYVYTMAMCNFVRLTAPAAPVSEAFPSAGAAASANATPSGAGSIAPPPAAHATPAPQGYAPSAPSTMAPPVPPSKAGAPHLGTTQQVVDRSGQPIILVVDDSKTIQKMVEIALKDLPYRLEMADDGYMAIEKAQSLDPQPQLVILDVIMPRLDGYKTCGQLRKIFAPKKVPVIMLTARDGTFDKIKGKLAGAAMYMAKPFEPVELQDAVTKLIGAR